MALDWESRRGRVEGRLLGKVEEGEGRECRAREAERTFGSLGLQSLEFT